MASEHLAIDAELTDVKIARVAAAILASDLDDIAVNYLGFTSDRVVDMKDQTQGSEEAFKRDILMTWRNKSVENTVKKLASILYKASIVQPQKIEEILRVSKEQALKQDIKKEPERGPSSGYRPASIHNGAPKLSDVNLAALAERICSQADLVQLAVSGLNMDARKVMSQMYVTSDVNSAAYVVLREWLKSRPDRGKAYEEMCSALKSVDMMFFMNALDGN